jgi:tetratricopeptide (TPR) repeat protein
MGRFRAISRQLRSDRVLRCEFAALVLLALLPLCLQSQESATSASLRGTVRDSQGKPVANAAVHLESKDPVQIRTARTDAQGKYSFTALRGGVYVLRTEMAGYSDAEIPSLFFAPKEAKNFDLVLLPAKSPAAGQASEFFDQPRFAVAGVTDTTSLGGHGSDTMVRTRETLAKETVSLSESTPGAEPAAASEQEKWLRASLERAPYSFEANHLLGKLLDNNGKAREAIPYFERAGELKASDYENSYDLALANAHAGNYGRARDQGLALVAHNDSAELHHLLGDMQEKLGDSLEAVREYQRAADLDPREPYVFDWGSELLLHHAPEPALEVFTRGNHLYPHSARMLIGLGAAWFARGSYDQAVMRVSEASDLNPNDPAPYLFMGKMQSAESAPSEKIVEKLQRFVAQQPDNAEANYYYAVGLWKLRKVSPDAAGAPQIESLLNHAIRLDPNFAAAYVQLGIVYADEKDYPKAISEYQQAIQVDPKMEEAHYRLAQAYRQAGDAAKAAAELRVYDQIARELAQETERERHEIRQFVYVLRDQPPAQIP